MMGAKIFRQSTVQLLGDNFILKNVLNCQSIVCLLIVICSVLCCNCKARTKTTTTFRVYFLFITYTQAHTRAPLCFFSYDYIDPF